MGSLSMSKDALSDTEAVKQEYLDKDSVPSVIDHAAERRLRNKIDLMILPTVCVVYLFCFIDRANIGNAKLAGFERDLGMKGYDYNTTLTMFYISYIIFEIPSNIICKWMGPGWFIPILTIAFGACSVANGYVHTKAQAMAVRFLLGIFEAGMLPGIAYYLSRWYCRAELTFRLACYIVTAPIAAAFSALLASGILKLDGFGGIHSWRMIFVIEGIITMGLGAIALITFTDSPASARWLTSAEKELAGIRVRRERLNQAQVLDKMDRTKLLRGIRNPVTLVTSIIYFLCNITVQGFTIFAPSIIRTLFSDKTVIQQQLLTAPPYIFGAIFTLILPLMSWKMDKRQIFIAYGPIPPIIGFVIFLASKNLAARYAATFLITTTIFTYGVIPNAQISANVLSDTARSSAIGFNVMIGNIGGLISTWSFLPFDAPDYRIGNGINLASQAMMLLVGLGLMVWMKKDNVAKDVRGPEIDHGLQNMTQEEIEDLDWKHPDFRWRI